MGAPVEFPVFPVFPVAKFEPGRTTIPRIRRTTMSDDDETVKPPDLQEWVKRYGGYDKIAIGKHRIARQC